VVLLVLLGFARPVHADVGARMREGSSLERQGKYEDALRKYQDALVLEPDNVRIHYDMGRALYRMKKHPEAAAEFQLGLLSKGRLLKARSLYNIGNCQFRQNGLDAAIASYSQALMLDPNDLQAKQNLEYCWKMKEQPKQQKSDSTGTKQPQDRPPQDQQQPQRQQAQAQKGEISREQAERMLQALQSREREDMKKQQKPPKQPGAGGKDW
jgi:tetratricopeptide (TPR) repeat protein